MKKKGKNIMNRQCIRVANAMSRFYSTPVEKVLQNIATYRHCRKVWREDWEGELQRFRAVVRAALHDRHKC